MNECMERLKNGIIDENPTFVMALGLCPTFAVSTTAINAVGMGLSSTVVLMFSNLLIAAIAKLIPDRVRLPGEIVVVASLVTIVQLLIQGFFPSIYDALGIYIPLIVVNCIILGRAEAYALGAKPLPAFFDGLGMGLGFTIALLLLGSIREIIGAGTLFGIALVPEAYHIAIFVLPPGAFFVMSFLVAAMQRYKEPKKEAYKVPSLDDVKTVVKKPAPKAAPAAGAVKAAAPAAGAVKAAAPAAAAVNAAAPAAAPAAQAAPAASPAAPAAAQAAPTAAPAAPAAQAEAKAAPEAADAAAQAADAGKKEGES